jgi:hypothetical protein
MMFLHPVPLPPQLLLRFLLLFAMKFSFLFRSIVAAMAIAFVVSFGALFWVDDIPDTFAQFSLEDAAELSAGEGKEGDVYRGVVPKLETEAATKPEQVAETILFTFVITPIFYFSAGIAVFMLTFAGFTLVKGRAEEEEITKAKKMLIWSFVGLLLIIGAYTIVVNLTELVDVYFEGLQ